ncbi:MAG: uncharacterized protein QG670_626 [Thermoproteota archaeon]|nr:uncharacterized protein [Thermoproteota archaeon]
MPLEYTPKEIVETIRMIGIQNLDIRTVTLGINLRDCCHPDVDRMSENILQKIVDSADKLVSTADRLQSKYGVPIINKRVAVTPIALIFASALSKDVEESKERAYKIAASLDKAAKEVGVDFIGGYSALVYKDMAFPDRVLIESVPQALASTETLCSSIVAASTKAGLNMDAVNLAANAVKETSSLTKDGVGCCRLVVFANAPEDNPFMAGAFFGVGEGDKAINVGVSGPGVIKEILGENSDKSLNELSEEIKKMSFKITRVGQLIGRELAEELKVRFGSIDLSLAPTMIAGDSVAEIVESIGVGSFGAPGSTAALAMLVDAVKKGGVMAAENVGGLSGAFIPVSEDGGALRALERGSLSLDKLEAMSSVCSVGLDMALIPGDTPVETIAGIMADELMVGVMNNKTTAVRVIPVPGKSAGEYVEFGGLLGCSRVMRVSEFVPKKLIERGGRIPAPMRSLTN